jgi:ElaB/YqjD/DUF883 family membrane-anchored ribosome-binding protein
MHPSGTTIASVGDLASELGIGIPHLYRLANRGEDTMVVFVPSAKEQRMTETTQQLGLGRQKIVEDLRVLLTDSEEMLRLAANVPGEGVGALRDRLGTHIESLQAALGDAQDAAHRRYRVAAVNAEHYVRHNPWQAVGIAAGVGFLLGVLATR